MPTDHIRYDVLARDALRGVLRRVLSDAAEHGLPGEHHFFITFLSKADGVKLSPRLLAQYPEEMTIILQHQFWDLVVTEDRFEVGLSFGGVPERLVVPFASIKSFFDPSVQFGLQFEPQEMAGEMPASANLAVPPASGLPVATPPAENGGRTHKFAGARLIWVWPCRKTGTHFSGPWPLLFGHGPVGKPVPTFPGHALECPFRLHA